MLIKCHNAILRICPSYVASPTTFLYFENLCLTGQFFITKKTTMVTGCTQINNNNNREEMEPVNPFTIITETKKHKYKNIKKKYIYNKKTKNNIKNVPYNIKNNKRF